MGLSDMAYGLWTGTAVNDTSSVVAAGYAFSEGAGHHRRLVDTVRVAVRCSAIFALVFSMSFASFSILGFKLLPPFC